MTEACVTMFASLRTRNYRLYLSGQCVSVAGNWMQNIGIGWLTLELSDSGVILGLVLAARWAPLLLLGPWGGLIADRLDLRRLLAVTQVGACILSFGLACAAWMHWVTLPVLLTAVLLLGLVSVFESPSRQSLISQLVAPELLQNAIALNSIAMNASRVLGPGLGGVIISAFGVPACFFVNAMSYLVVIATLVALRRGDMRPVDREVRARGQIVAGLRYVRRTPDLLWPLTMVTVTGIFTWEFPITLPLVTATTFGRGASAYGTAMACLGAGSIAGGLLAARRRTVSVRSLAASSGVWGLLIAIAAAAPTLAVEYAALVLVGSAAITFNSAAKTLLQLRSAPQLRGRVMALWSIAWQGSTVVGAPVIGVIGATLGPRYALLTGGLAAVGVGLLAGLRHASSAQVAASGVQEPFGAADVATDR